MAVQSSPVVVRDMKKTLLSSVKNIQKIQQNISSSARSASNWNDTQGTQYQALMKKIVQLIQGPVETLNVAVPKLEKLAQSLDSYEKVKF